MQDDVRSFGGRHLPSTDETIARHFELDCRGFIALNNLTDITTTALQVGALVVRLHYLGSDADDPAKVASTQVCMSVQQARELIAQLEHFCDHLDQEPISKSLPS
ncbi:hypothetical protein [Rhizosaccharibacter radicis]|uniref:DUF3077 domain-containing protein n=1 Tax=Rhizosaccharibacter radicis TaxID=2782605 RepID=A0ABT1VV81_9PROT|nr:hypothetical protein [Acetobacteraceae bacterium KSS12]